MHVTSTDLGTAGFFLLMCQNILDQPKVEMVTNQGAIQFAAYQCGVFGI